MTDISRSYPSELFDELFELARLPEGARVLEIGAGIGEATLPLAERGCRVAALEPAADLADIAKGKLAAYANVEIVASSFEAWAAQQEPFDLVLSATAMHGRKEEVRFGQPASLLRPDGHFAVVRRLHARGGDESFFLNAALLPDADSGAVETEFGAGAGLRAEEMREWADCGYFRPIVSRTYFTQDEYGRDEYLALLATYDDLRRLPPDSREKLFACIAALIDFGYGGTNRKCTRSELFLARRAANPHEGGPHR